MNTYRSRQIKTIKLPSGATIDIHKLNTFDEPFIAARRKRNGADEEGAAFEDGLRFSRYVLANPKNGPLCYGGECLRIVDKPEAGTGEITITELDQADADKIVAEVVDFSGLGRAGREAAKTFPEGQAPAESVAHSGQDLRVPAGGPAEPSAR